MFNRTFEEYEVGEQWVSRGRTLTESDIVNFAGVSGDFYVLHTDAEYAKGTPFGQRIAHGMLVLSISTGLMDFFPGKVLAFYGIDQLRFTAPTFIGDTVHVEMELLEKHERRSGGLLVVKHEVKKQTGEPVIVGTLKILVGAN
ncbi:MaoC/PaaZ C-terminal domain-containing protein [Effusibacillus consociatus]|uniref:MaoC/PaaZ C-terminal domain-containing protein n=1 Tax=Effusibacillus consociatus TaxID=1117041 RepID=A0ABV9Q8V0_9BACL